MHEFNDSVLNLRIRMPIVNYSNPRNFITKITQYENICSIKNSMSYLPEVIPIALDLSLKKTTGTINLTNPGTISHNSILEKYRDVVEPQFNWNNFSIEEQSKLLLSDRSNNKLNTEKLESLYPSISNINDAIDICFVNYK